MIHSRSIQNTNANTPTRYLFFFFLLHRHPPSSTLFPYTTLFRSLRPRPAARWALMPSCQPPSTAHLPPWATTRSRWHKRSEEHTSELQSLRHLVCRLLLEKKKKKLGQLSRHV